MDRRTKRVVKEFRDLEDELVKDLRKTVLGYYVGLKSYEVDMQRIGASWSDIGKKLAPHIRVLTTLYNVTNEIENITHEDEKTP